LVIQMLSPRSVRFFAVSQISERAFSKESGNITATFHGVSKHIDHSLGLARRLPESAAGF
jgi:hypothetical protein